MPQICAGISPFVGMLLSISALTVSVTRTAQGAEDGDAKLAPQIERILAWFPADTETIVVARAFKVGSWKLDATRRRPWTSIQCLALGDLPLLEEDAGLNEILGREVSVAINGGREFEVVSAFGSLRYQGCSVVQFKEPLPDAGQAFVAAMRRRARQMRTIAQTEVYVFPDRTEMESHYKPRPWQGQFIAMPAADLLLCATRDKFLQELLERFNRKVPARQGLPPDLPEWKYVDPASPAWSVRHVPDRERSDAISGLAWCLRPHNRPTLEVTYVPIDDERALALARMWEKADLDARPSIQKQPDGTVSVTIDVGKEKPGLWYPMVLYWSSGAK